MPHSHKHQKFIAEYLIDLNATQAARRAGYSSKTAKQQGARLLNHPTVRAAIIKATARTLEKAGLTARDVLEAIRRPIAGDVRKLFDERNNLRPIRELEPEEAALLGGFEVIIKNAQAGDGHTDTVHKIKLVPRERYVEMGAKHFKLLTDVVSVQTDDARMARLLAGRKRAAGK